jgi:hypothetical protein
MTRDKQPWFLVTRPADADRPGLQWVRVDVASGGKIVARAIAPAGWLLLLAFVIVLPASIVAIWPGLVVGGQISVIEAIVLTVG